MTNNFAQLNMINEDDYVVWTYKDNYDLWKVEEVGWCGGYAITVLKDPSVRFVVDPKDIRLADSSEIESKKKMFVADEYECGDKVVVSFDKDRDDTSIYEVLELVLDEDEEYIQEIILNNCLTGVHAKIYEREIRLATPDELRHGRRIWG